jgi:hypothetical protein
MLGGVSLNHHQNFQNYSLEFYSVRPIWILVPDIPYAIEFIFERNLKIVGLIPIISK